MTNQKAVRQGTSTRWETWNKSEYCENIKKKKKHSSQPTNYYKVLVIHYVTTWTWAWMGFMGVSNLCHPLGTQWPLGYKFRSYWFNRVAVQVLPSKGTWSGRILSTRLLYLKATAACVWMFVLSKYFMQNITSMMIPVHSATFRRFQKSRQVLKVNRLTLCLNFLKLTGFESRLLKKFCKVFFRTKSHGLMWSIMSFILSWHKNLWHINFCNPLTSSSSNSIFTIRIILGPQKHSTNGSNTGGKNIHSFPRQQSE